MLSPVVALTAILASQEVGGLLREHSRFDPDPGDFSTCEVAAGGDLDSDGVPDLALRFRGAGRVEARSGRTHAILWTVPTQIEFSVGSVVFVRDVDRDGHDELAVGSRAQDRVTLYSGANGSVLWTRVEPALEGFGAGVDASGDMTGDGIADLVIHAPDAADPLSAYDGACVILSGSDGSIVHLLYLGTNYVSGYSGRQVAAAGDVDLDGREDFLVGNVMHPGPPRSTLLFSGATGALLRTMSGFIPDLFGASVTSAGDVNDDGVPDQLVADTGWAILYCFSGADGSELWRCNYSSHSAFLGVGLDSGPDCDGDDVPDVIVGAPMAFRHEPRSYGAVLVHSGKTGALIWRYEGSGTDRIGYSVAVLGDADANALPEFLVDGNSMQSGPWSAARILEWTPGLRATADRFSVSRGGRVEFQSRWPLDFAGHRYVLLASARGSGPTRIGGVEIPLTPDAWTARILQHSAPALRNAIGRLDARASTSTVLQMPPGAGAPLLGSTIWFSMVVGSAGRPVAASVARTITFIP